MLANSITSRLLAVFVGLLSILSVCSAAPKIKLEPTDPLARSGVITHSISVRGPHELVARKPTPEIVEFKEKFDAANKKVVTNDAAFISFKDGKMSIASSGFNGCVGLVIATRKGALVGHFTQTEEGLKIAQNKFSDLYKENTEDLSGGQPVLYGQSDVDETTWTFPEVIPDFAKVVKDLTSRDPEEKKYIEPLEAWVDQDGLPLDDADYDNYQSGGFICENAGGGEADTIATFISVSIQKQGMEPPN